MTICKVDHSNASYRFGNSGAVANWFDEEGFDSSCFSIRDSFDLKQAGDAIPQEVIKGINDKLQKIRK